MTDATDDLATTDETVDTTAGDGGAAAGGAQGGAAGAGGAAGKDGAAKGAEGDKGSQSAGAGKGTIASGGDVKDGDGKDDKGTKAYWPTDWREKAAEHIAAGDKKAYDRELKRLQRITDPAGLYGAYRELDNRLNGGGLIKVPGKDAKPEEIANFHKALGVPEKAEDYLKDLKLENGAVIGDADKPMVAGFTEALHKSGAPPAAVQAAINWYYKQQEDAAAAIDQADDDFQRESQAALKEEWGPALKRELAGIKTLFKAAPGGADDKNPKSLYARLVSGRTADGKIIGNDPDMLRWLVSLVTPAEKNVEEGIQNGMTLEAEKEKIEQIMRTDRPLYNKQYAARYGEILAKLGRVQAH